MKAKGEEMQSTNLHKSTQRFVEISEDLWRREKGLGVSSQELGLAAKNAESAKPWPMVRLGDVCEVINGLWKGTKEPLINVGVIRATNFTKQCEFDVTKTVFIDVEEKKFLKRKLQFGDIIVERSGGGPNQPVGRVIYFDQKDGNYSLSNFTSALRVKNSIDLYPYFLYRVLVACYVTGVTEKMQSNSVQLRNIDFERYLNIQIPLPSLSVQKEIVERLEKELGEADKIAAEFKRMAELADKEFKAELDEVFGGLGNGELGTEKGLGVSSQELVSVAVIVHAKSAKFAKSDVESQKSGTDFFNAEKQSSRETEKRLALVAKNAENDWPMVKLGDVCAIKGGFAFKSKEYTDSGLQVVRISDLSGNEISKKDAVYYPETVGLEKYVINEECILICLTGSIGKMAIVNDGVKRYLNQRVGLLTCGCEILIKYVWHYLHSERVLDIWDKAKTSVNGNLRNSDITDLKIPLPPLSVQKEIVAKLDAAKEKCEKLKAEAERGLRAAENLRKAILSEAFEL